MRWVETSSANPKLTLSSGVSALWQRLPVCKGEVRLSTLTQLQFQKSLTFARLGI